jgi:hypothetical protein
MCMVLFVLLAGPRFAIILWWLVEPSRWSNAFSTFIWPLLGFVFLPWTTLALVAVAPFGNVDGWDAFWLSLAFLLDLSSLATRGLGNRVRAFG